jgi:hypothetical protein
LTLNAWPRKDRSVALQEETARAALWRLINGYQLSQAIHVLATLGVADHLADGPRSSAELARATEANEDALYRVLRAVASIGVLEEDDARRFSLTPMGEWLRNDMAGSLAGWAALVGRPYQWGAWAQLLHAVKTGENAFQHLHGVDAWEYRRERPEENAIFDAAMQSFTRGLNDALLDAYDFGRFACIVDVGGGNGALLAGVLREHPNVTGVLFDQPHVVDGAEPVLQEARVGERCRVVGGSFFDSVPEGGDAYVMKSILHDWDDAEATAILRVCRRAMRDESRLLVIERLVEPPNRGAPTKFSDLNMLTILGGRERTLAEFRVLLEAGGFELQGETATAAGFSVIEAVPA